jgi:hypothetical protein
MVNNQQERAKNNKNIRRKISKKNCAPEIFLRETVRRTG